jgi:hypothetical protein
MARSQEAGKQRRPINERLRDRAPVPLIGYDRMPSELRNYFGGSFDIDEFHDTHLEWRRSERATSLE